MALENTNGLMDAFTKVFMSMIRSKDMASTYGRTAKSITVGGEMASSTVLDHLRTAKEKNGLEYGRMVLNLHGLVQKKFKVS